MKAVISLIFIFGLFRNEKLNESIIGKGPYSDQTRVSFFLIDDSKVTNENLLKKLKEIIYQEKYVIIDLSINKTIRAVKGSLTHGENLFYLFLFYLKQNVENIHFIVYKLRVL